jgi:hypothetical protein
VTLMELSMMFVYLLVQERLHLRDNNRVSRPKVKHQIGDHYPTCI